MHLKNIVGAVKLFLLILTLAFIVYKLFYTYQVNNLWQQFTTKQKHPDYYLLLMVLILMPANWGLETIKWQQLINFYEPVSFTGAAKSILSGVALSIITPNQLGDFAGRVIHLKKFNKIKGSLVAVVGHTAQLLITIFWGITGAVVIMHHKQLINPVIYQYNTLIAIILLLLFFVFYLVIPDLFKRINKLKFLKPVAGYSAIFESFNKPTLSVIFSVSFLRYLVFMAQYYFLLLFFGIDIGIENGVAVISVIFSAQSIVPSFIFLDIGLRGASAIWFLEMYSSNTIAILLSAYTLWIINMMLPAIAGLVVIYKTKFSTEK